MGSSSTFDSRAERYEQLIDWPKRLANEEPFYRRWFECTGVRRVLDAACGTGRHAAMFHSWGLSVEGADLSEGMIRLARTRFGEPGGLNWVVRSFESPVEKPGSFDAAICVGNSLALAGDLRTVHAAVTAMLGALRPGGLLVLQVLNLWSLPEGKTIWQKQRLVKDRNSEEHILLKSIHRCGDRGYVDFADLQIVAGELKCDYDSAEFLGIDAEHLVSVIQARGGEQVQCFGSFSEQVYVPPASGDLIVVARRRF